MSRSRMAGIAAVALLIATPAFAQSISLGAKAGASFATIGGDGADELSNRTGLSVGAMAEVGISPMFSVQPEVMFVQKGADGAFFPGLSGSFNLTYIEIPVLAKITFPTPGPTRPYIYLGPSASFQSGCSVSGEIDGASFDVDCETEDSENPTKSVDFGIIGGLGMGLGMGPGEASFDVRYNMGMSNLIDTPEGEDALDAKNRAFSVMIGYAITLGM